ncbi:MAG: LysR family transcriptional regulator [Gammaproteobacteria bacterium]|nr:LysR family transcriptional regulator [Gammaproteobacteria bacterium]
MMLRSLTYLVALARERHFGRAAAACHVSQPALSNALRQLEQEFGVVIVERGKRFKGFTPGGEKVLAYARQALAEHESVITGLKAADESLTGELRVGAIPTALPLMAHILAPFSAQHPSVRLTLHSLTSRQIQTGLHEFELDAGVTYLDNEPLSGVRSVSIMNERYYLLTRRRYLTNPEAREVSWTEAASLRLGLLTPNMQNRRIIDAAFGDVGAAVEAAIETDALIDLYTCVRFGSYSSIVPSALLTVFSPDDDMVALPLRDPEVIYQVGIVLADRNPPAPLADILANLHSETAIRGELVALIRDAIQRHWTGPTKRGRRAG